MDKLISVIIPAYNIESYIERCLESVISQTYQNLEIIVVDDGSTDKTGELIDCYAKKDTRIKVIHKVNGGVSSARNEGIKVAAGDYIGFVDGDDKIDEDMYEILIRLVEKEHADIAHCGYQMVFPNRVDYYYNTKKKKIQDNKEGMLDLLSGKMIEPALYNKIYRRELFEDILLDEDLKINEDLKVNYQLFKKSHKSVYYDVTKYSYMIRSSSATATNSIIQKNKDVLSVYQYILNDCKDEDVKQIMYERYIYLLMTIVRQGNLDDRYKTFQQEIKKILRNECKKESYKKVKNKKLKIMVFMVLHCPWMFRFIYWIYDKKTGNSKKYLVNN